MICPQCGVRVAYDAANCYNCKLDLIKAQREEAKTPRRFTFGALLLLFAACFIAYFAVVQGVRYSRWNAYHDQVKKVNAYDSSSTAPKVLPIPPNDPIQGSLRNWPDPTDPTPRTDLVADNSIVIVK